MRKKSGGRDFGGFVPRKRPFWLLLEYETLDRSENLSEDSSNKDLSNHVGHSYLKNQFDPPGAHSLVMTSYMVIPRGQKVEKIFFCFFLRIGSFWFQKCNKKNLVRNFPLPGHLTWDLEFFRKIWKFSKKKFSFIFSNWLNLSRKKRKKYFCPLWGHDTTWDLEFFRQIWKVFRLWNF